MKPYFFRRALGYGNRAGGSFWRWLLAAASVILVLLLLETLGLWTELLASRGQPPEGIAGSSRALGWVRAWHLMFNGGVVSPGRQSLALLLVGLGMAFLWVLARIALVRVARRRAEGVASHLRAELHRRMFHLEGAELVSRQEVAIIDLFVNRVELIRQGLLAWWLALPHDILLLLGLAALAVAVHPWVGLAAVLVICLGLLALSSFEARTRARQAIVAERAALNMAALIDNLRQPRLVAGNLLEEVPGQPFGELLEQYRAAALRRQRGEDVPRLWAGLATAAAVVLLAWVAGVNVLREPPLMDVASMVALSAAALCAFPAVRRLRDLPRLVERAEPAAEAVFSYLDRTPVVGQSSDARPMPPLARGLELNGVTVIDRMGRRLLDNVSISVAAKGRVAVVSADPDTPLALGTLLARFRDPQAGEARADGVDIRKFTIGSLRSRIALLLADGLLFNGSVSDNIGCGDERFTPQKIVEAAKAAHANDCVLRLPDGFDTVLGDHTSRLEPDEAFRIGLARVLLREPDLVIVEEPAVAGDTQAGEAIELAIQALVKDRTSIIVARRLATLRAADRVLLFQDGVLRGEGTHAELLQQSDLYRHLVYLRYNEYQPA
jgi:ATP-binding cassette subfamily B protein